MKKYYLFFLLIPIWLLYFKRQKKVLNHLGAFYGQQKNTLKVFNQYKRSSFFRILFWSFAWICLVVAIINPSWGIKSVGVTKNASAVSFVFDTSRSMLAEDVLKTLGRNRLLSSARYAEMILSNLEDIEVSAVIAKGDGVLAVPLTSDYEAIFSLTKSLSVDLMSAPGTNLGKGIKAAINSFSSQSAKFATIILFTDGGETFQELENACFEAVRYGMNVVIVGFGSEEGTKILAGDKVTEVHSKLEENYLKTVAKKINEKLPLNKNAVTYVRAFEKGSVTKVLEIILSNKNSSGVQNGYELHSVERHGFFIFLSLLFICLGFIFSEVNFFSYNKFKDKKTKTIITVIFLLSFLYSCNVVSKSSIKILEGTTLFHSQNYEKSVAKFFESYEMLDENSDYALFGLATSYLMLKENENALKKMEQISPDAPEHILFGIYYNSGIALYEKGHYEKASEFFKKAMSLDSNNVNAKINYELSKKQNTLVKDSQTEISKMIESKKQSTIENAVFTIIKEEEKERWQSQISNENISAQNDY